MTYMNATSKWSERADRSNVSRLTSLTVVNSTVPEISSMPSAINERCPEYVRNQLSAQ